MSPSLNNFSVECQEFGRWCWAALGAAIERFYSQNSRVTQCTVAMDRLHLDCCGKDKPNKNCNTTQSFRDVLCSIHCFEDMIPKSVDPQVVHDQIRDQKPVCVRLESPDRMEGHIVAIKIYYDNDPKIHLQISDPEIGECITTFDCLKCGYRGFSNWSQTYFTKKG